MLRVPATLSNLSRSVRGAIPRSMSPETEAYQDHDSASDDKPSTRVTLGPRKIYLKRLPSFSNDLQHCLHEVFRKATPYTAKLAKDDRERLLNKLFSRKVPPERWNVRQKREVLKDRALAHLVESAGSPDMESMTELDREGLLKEADQMVEKRLKVVHPTFEPVTINTKYKAALRYHALFQGSYATMYKIFEELHQRDPNLDPKDFLDYGSGMALTFWAAREFWPDANPSHYCIYSSNYMLDFTQLCLRGGRMDNDLISGQRLVLRRSIPGRTHGTFDVVVSSFGMSECESKSARLKLLNSLWDRTEKYLILIEFGNKYGFQLISEARSYLLFGTGFRRNKDLSEMEPPSDRHVFGPCPHEKQCPILKQKGVCKFPMRYGVLPMFRAGKIEDPTIFPVSYLVIAKGARPERLDKPEFSRVLQYFKKRGQRGRLEVCRPEGHLSNVWVHTTHTKQAKSIAKNSRENDLVTVITEPIEE